MKEGVANVRPHTPVRKTYILISKESIRFETITSSSPLESIFRPLVIGHDSHLGNFHVLPPLFLDSSVPHFERFPLSISTFDVLFLGVSKHGPVLEGFPLGICHLEWSASELEFIFSSFFEL